MKKTKITQRGTVGFYSSHSTV